MMTEKSISKYPEYKNQDDEYVVKMAYDYIWDMIFQNKDLDFKTRVKGREISNLNRHHDLEGRMKYYVENGFVSRELSLLREYSKKHGENSWDITI